MNADPGSLNPLRAPSEWALRISMDTVFESLVRYRPIGDSDVGQYQAGLASQWSVSQGGREILVVLDEKAHWQDGRPVTALDVQFSIEAAKSKWADASHLQGVLANLSAIDILGRKRFRLRLERPDAFVLRELAQVPILPEHLGRHAALQRQGDWVGSGPYRVSRDGANVILRRDPSYWGEAPAIENVVFVRSKDAALALRDAKEGRMDIVPELIPEHYPEQLNIPGVAKNFSVVRLAPPKVSYIVLQTRKAPFDDANMRRAIAHLVDRTTLMETAGGLARPVPGIIWPQGPGNGAEMDASEYDTELAASLLDAAGWRDDHSGGVRSRNGQRLMVTVLATEEKNATRDVVLNALRKAGFVIDLRVGNVAVLRNRLRDGEFDLAFATWAGDADRDLSPLLESTGKNNYGRYKSPVVDKLLDDIRMAWDPSERRPLLTTLAQLLSRSMPLVALMAPDPRGIAHKRVQGLAVWNGWFSIRDMSLAAESE